MAKLFLSYSRKDEAKARRFTEWLEREGHVVWRDEDDIGGGASFSAEIEKALQGAEAVLVLWSASSVQSAWVRDEAAFGRDASKLIPFSLDGTEPPLGFRQFQSLGLARWKGHREPENAEKIRQAVARVASHQEPPADGRGARRPHAERFPHNWLLIGGAIAVAAAVLAIFLWQRSSSGQQIAITVLSSPQSSDRAMAADYANVAAADMAAILPRRFDRATVIGPAEANAGSSGYRMLISTDSHGPAASASLTLSDQDGRTTLWSENWTVDDSVAADLKAQVSSAASKAAVCLAQARGGSKRLFQPVLGIYLSGCTGLGGTKLSNAEFVSMFERVTKAAPDFGPGWDYLALSRSWIAESLPESSPAYAGAVKSAREAIAVARKLNPDSAISYDAEFHLNSGNTFKALQILDRAAKVDPDDGRIKMHLSDQLMSVGRMTDSVQAAQAGVELEPGSPYTRYQFDLALIYSGQFSRAQADLAEARKKWPSDFAINLADFSLQFRYGDPKRALELLPRIVHSSDADLARYRKVIEARMNPTPAKIDEAIAALDSRVGDYQAVKNEVLLALGNFGRVDEAYKLLEDPKFQPGVDRSALFRPDFARVRADPRFMLLAARLGLVRYWRQTGYWPDFCSDEKLPYDCKSEAAKFPT